jgi:hypothetical protein
MARSALTLEEVAHECGYARASHFCRDDKAEPGLTPTPWRRKLIDRFTEPLPPAVAPVREYGARASERVMPAKEMTDCGGRIADWANSPKRRRNPRVTRGEWSAVVLFRSPHSAFRFPQSAIRNPQSAIRHLP